MVVSNSTSSEIVRILRKHLSDDLIMVLLNDLRTVHGNKSFKQTIENVIAKVKKEVQPSLF